MTRESKEKIGAAVQKTSQVVGKLHKLSVLLGHNLVSAGSLFEIDDLVMDRCILSHSRVLQLAS